MLQCRIGLLPWRFDSYTVCRHRVVYDKIESWWLRRYPERYDGLFLLLPSMTVQVLVIFFIAACK